MEMPLSVEKQSLSAHVDMCSERYRGLREDLVQMSNRITKLESEMATRIDKLESIVLEIKDSLVKKENGALKTLITVGMAIIASLIGTIGGLVWYVITYTP